MDITLPPDIERALTDEASKRGTTPELLALDSLREQFLAERQASALTDGYNTLAEFLTGHIGVLLHRSKRALVDCMDRARADGDCDPR